MWFKNLNIYQFETKFENSAEELDRQLESMCFTPCGNSSPTSIGWVPPVGKGEDAPLVHAANGILLICLKTEEKLLPASVLREQLAEKIDKIEETEGRKVKRKEKEGLKDEIYFSLLPQAFTKSSLMYAYIDLQQQVMVVDSASTNKAEELLTFLRKTLGSLKVEIPEIQSPMALMTDWIKNDSNPVLLQLENSCTLQNPQDEKSLVRCQKQDLGSKNILSFLNDGFCAIQLSLAWSEQLAFTLKQDFTIRQVKFLDAVKEAASDIFTETPEQRFDADFAIMTETLRNFTADLLSIFSTQNTKKAAATSEKESEEVAA